MCSDITLISSYYITYKAVVTVQLELLFLVFILCVSLSKYVPMSTGLWRLQQPASLPEAGVKGNCAAPDVGVATKLESSGGAELALNGWAASLALVLSF